MPEIRIRSGIGEKEVAMTRKKHAKTKVERELSGKRVKTPHVARDAGRYREPAGRRTFDAGGDGIEINLYGP